VGVERSESLKEMHMRILKTVFSGCLAFEEAPGFMMLLVFERIGKRIGRVEEFHPPRRFPGVVGG
jgi:hypothetical protein